MLKVFGVECINGRFVLKLLREVFLGHFLDLGRLVDTLGLENNSSWILVMKELRWWFEISLVTF